MQLANLGRPRRPARTRTSEAEPVLPDPETAARQLTGIVDRAVREADLPDLRRLQQAASKAADALVAGRRPDVRQLNILARGATARVELVVADEGLRQQMVWDDASVVAELARRLIGELATIDPLRIRVCGRDVCTLVFYDTTRSRTQRWHAENPCGWRERQEQRRRP
ncbi:CGNR zinc finger domain-containing protein [Kribbella sp. NPDC051586]|uniref:CGNR zinc finger domain-containing protein n=1 Tax=Kribbella sp. NPDC051586 TaxID=3364118 RepID=UPI00378EF15E